MDRRDFGKALIGGSGMAALAAGSAHTAPAQNADVPYRVLRDLKVRRLGDIHTGGDYHTLVGAGPTDVASLDYFRRFNARYLTVRANTGATADGMKQWPTRWRLSQCRWSVGR